MVLHVMDDDELDFPFNGPTRFEGLELPEHLNCNPRALREGYLEGPGRFLDDVRRGCAQNGVDYALVRTSQPLDVALAAYLNHRLAGQARTDHSAERATAGVGPGLANGKRTSTRMFPVVHESLLWGLPLLGVPILIHLINMMRHRRVKLGGHGVSAGQPEAPPHLDHPQAIAAAAAADRRRGGGGADAGPAAQPVDVAARRKPRRITSCSGTTAFRCPTAGPTPAPSTRPSRSIARLADQAGRGRTIRRRSRFCAFRRPAPAAAAPSPTCSKSR